jgi:5-methylcytosine-specific restriction enzyme A
MKVFAVNGLCYTALALSSRTASFLMRNPKWHRDEIILALDLYFSGERGSISKTNKKIIELSETLNKLPIFESRPDAEKFRNANGVALKLSNFLAIDPNYLGKGMESYSNLDKKLFEEYSSDIHQLKFLAKEIKTVAFDPDLNRKVYEVEDDEQTINDSVMEGQVLYKLHKVRERDSKIVTAKKTSTLSAIGFLSCEACVFNFESSYGELGKGYIECHHRTPLFHFSAQTRTTLDDLALVCSNCHRMLHRSSAHLSIDDLKMMIRYDRL